MTNFIPGEVVPSGSLDSIEARCEVIRRVAEPDVSVIIPLFNRRDLIHETLDSVDAQTIAEKIETIVIDDGSTDDGAEVVRLRRSGRGGLVLVQTPNQGASAARNVGFGICRTPYVCFLDSDDLISPEKIETQMDLLSGPTGLDYVSCDWAAFEGHPGKILQRYGNEGDSCWPILPDFLHGRFFPNGDALYRRESCSKAGPWPEKLRTFEDWAWHVAMGTSCPQGRHISKCLLFVRQHKSPRLSDSGDRKRLVKDYCRYIQFVICRLRRNRDVWLAYGHLARRALLRGAIWTMRVNEPEIGLRLMRRAAVMEPSPWRRASFFGLVQAVRLAGPAKAIQIYDRLKVARNCLFIRRFLNGVRKFY